MSLEEPVTEESAGPPTDEPTDEPAADRQAVGAWLHIRAISGNPVTQAGEHRLMHESGLTGGPMRALRNLPLDEPLSMRQLAARMGCDNSYVTPLVDTLEKRGLAHRRPHPTDRRVKVITLTEEGRRLAARAQHEYATPPPAFSALTPAELTLLDGLLARIAAADE